MFTGRDFTPTRCFFWRLIFTVCLVSTPPDCPSTRAKGCCRALSLNIAPLHKHSWTNHQKQVIPQETRTPPPPLRAKSRLTQLQIPVASRHRRLPNRVSPCLFLSVNLEYSEHPLPLLLLFLPPPPLLLPLLLLLLLVGTSSVGEVMPRAAWARSPTMIRAQRCPLERKNTRNGPGGDLLGDEASSEAGCGLVSAWVR